MTKIAELINKDSFESKKVEFKKIVEHDFPEKWLKTIDAFANTEGGMLYFGVDDEGNVEGLNSTEINNEILYINHIIDSKIVPTINYEFHRIPYNNKILLCLEVKKNKKLPVWMTRNDNSKVIYIRKDSESRLATTEEIENLVLASKREDFDAKSTRINFKNVSFKKLNEVYKEKTNSETEISLKLFKSKKMVDEDNFLTYTGLLFMDNCEFENANLHCRFWPNFTKGSDKVLDDKTYKGNLLILLENALSFIKNHSKEGYIKEDDGRRHIVSYPRRAVFEAVVNALVHRDYYINGSQIDIDIFKDRLEITSPGSFLLPGSAQVYDMGKIPSRRRNTNICDVFQMCMLMEESGSGFSKIIEDYANATEDYHPSIYSDSAQFIITLKDLSYLKEYDGSGDMNSKILLFCKTPKTRSEIQKFLHIKSRSYISSKILKPLLKSGKLKETQNKNSPLQKYISIISKL